MCAKDIARSAECDVTHQSPYHGPCKQPEAQPLEAVLARRIGKQDPRAPEATEPGGKQDEHPEPRTRRVPAQRRAYNSKKTQHEAYSDLEPRPGTLRFLAARRAVRRAKAQSSPAKTLARCPGISTMDGSRKVDWKHTNANASHAMRNHQFPAGMMIDW